MSFPLGTVVLASPPVELLIDGVHDLPDLATVLLDLLSLDVQHAQLELMSGLQLSSELPTGVILEGTKLFLHKGDFVFETEGRIGF